MIDKTKNSGEELKDKVLEIYQYVKLKDKKVDNRS